MTLGLAGEFERLSVHLSDQVIGLGEIISGHVCTYLRDALPEVHSCDHYDDDGQYADHSAAIEVRAAAVSSRPAWITPVIHPTYTTAAMPISLNIVRSFGLTMCVLLHDFAKLSTNL